MGRLKGVRLVLSKSCRVQALRDAALGVAFLAHIKEGVSGSSSGFFWQALLLLFVDERY